MGWTLFEVVVLKFGFIALIPYFGSKISELVLESVQIVRRKEVEEALIELRSDGIVRVVFKENLVMDVATQEKLFAHYLEICQNEKYGFLFEAMDNVTITKEARENSKKLETTAPSIATAVIANSLPYRLIANFYLKFNKPKIPFKVFRLQEEGIYWLKEQVKKKKK